MDSLLLEELTDTDELLEENDVDSLEDELETDSELLLDERLSELDDEETDSDELELLILSEDELLDTL